MNKLFKYIALFCFFTLLTTMVSQAQTEERIISGLLLEKGTDNRIESANVTNLRTNQVVSSSSYGVFTIQVALGDSLSVSKVGYGPVKTAIQTFGDILVDLQPGLQIETVVVTRSTKEAEMKGYLKDFEKKGIYNGGHNRVGTYLASPATALYNLFGQEAKNAKRFERYMTKELEATKIDRVFNKTLVSSLTELQGDELQSFMDMYRPSISSIERWGEYDLMSYITNSFKAWDKNGRPKSERLPKLEIPPQEK